MSRIYTNKDEEKKPSIKLEEVMRFFEQRAKKANILGYKHSDETKLKMSNIKKGKILSDKTKINISLGHKGIKYTEKRQGRI